MPVKLYFTDPNNQDAIEDFFYEVDVLHKKILSLKEKFRNQEYPIGVDLERENSNFLSIGLGNEEWVLIRTLGEDEQHCSIGDASREGVTAFYLQQWTEVPQKWLIPYSEAWEAVVYWFQTGELCDCIQWTDQNC